MNIYIVIKTGVYRHDVVGAFGTIEAACTAGEAAARAEPDAHHTFDVVECTLDAPGERSVAEVKRTDRRHAENNRWVIDSTDVRVTVNGSAEPR